jgi:hypothetical protein
VAPKGKGFAEAKLNGQVIIDELIRNTEVGRFEMGYSVLLPCIFSIYLNSEDHGRLKGVFELIAEDAKRALRARVAQLNSKSFLPGVKRPGKQAKEYRIACADWVLEFFPDSEGTVPVGDVEIHSELAETEQPGFRGAKTTLMDREPSVTAPRPGTNSKADTRQTADRVYAEIRYEDESGLQMFAVKQNQVRIGRGGNDLQVDVALYTTDEVSREHFVIRRDSATGQFSILDKSTNGTWVNGRRLKRGVEEPIPERAEIGVAEVLTLNFEARL